jgi:prepilin-type N-terminal cleavage/methylation domain-containing protein
MKKSRSVNTNLYDLSTMSHELYGFTVVELLVAMVVSSLVAGFVVPMYLFAEKGMARQQKRCDVRDVVYGCMQRITIDVESCTEMERCDDTSLVLQQNPFKEIRYHFDPSRVWRNGIPMNDLQIELNVHVSSNEDTISNLPKRSWNIRVVGWQGPVRDSAEVNISTMISSQELVDSGIRQTAR